MGIGHGINGMWYLLTASYFIGNDLQGCHYTWESSIHEWDTASKSKVEMTTWDRTTCRFIIAYTHMDLPFSITHSQFTESCDIFFYLEHNIASQYLQLQRCTMQQISIMELICIFPTAMHNNQIDYTTWSIRLLHGVCCILRAIEFFCCYLSR